MKNRRRDKLEAVASGPSLGEEGDSGDRGKLIPDTFQRRNEQEPGNRAAEE